MKISYEFLVAVVAALALAACSARSPAAVPPAGEADRPPANVALRVVLLWDAPVDLDLYVTDPAMESVYFANRRSGSGGVLEKDAGCTTEPRRESTSWRKAEPGRYRVSLDFIDRCGQDVREVGYRLLVDAAGRRQERTGTIHLSRFLYQAFEFDLGEAKREESPHHGRCRR